jgi:uncharacterized membrane protein
MCASLLRGMHIRYSYYNLFVHVCLAWHCTARHAIALCFNAMMCFNTIQCKYMQCNVWQCSAMQCSQRNTLQCKAIQCHAVQNNAKLCNARQYNAMQGIAKQCKAIQSAMQRLALQGNTMQAERCAHHVMQTSAMHGDAIQFCTNQTFATLHVNKRIAMFACLNT